MGMKQIGRRADEAVEDVYNAMQRAMTEPGDKGWAALIIVTRWKKDGDAEQQLFSVPDGMNPHLLAKLFETGIDYFAQCRDGLETD